MKRGVALLLWLILLRPWQADAHVGSPDVFYEGQAGTYPVAVTIRMPGVVPGLAKINVQVQSEAAVQVSFVPIFATNAVSNAPPAEEAQLVAGETNLFSGELWLMTSGAYSINVQVRGKSGQGAVLIPVDSVATRQLPLPPQLGEILLGLGLLLFCSGVAIIAAAAGEAVLPPDALPGLESRRRYWRAAAVTTLVFVLALIGGWKWWNAEEADYGSRMLKGGPPHLAAEVRVKDSQRILGLTVGWDKKRELAPDHGKLMHLFLVRQPSRDAFAHLHPVRTGDETFDAPLPPLPEGDYQAFCDLTMAEGSSFTATNTVHIPSASTPSSAAPGMKPDSDDSWAGDASIAARDNAGSETVCRLPGGQQVIWKSHPVLRAQQDAGLRFEVRDEAGHPVPLEPYMGMTSHAAVLRSDDRVFSHLHPSGNFSMAAQLFFAAKVSKETALTGTSNAASPEAICGPGGNGSSVITLPYEFPSAGDYRIWVQFKTAGEISTAIFDTTVR